MIEDDVGPSITRPIYEKMADIDEDSPSLPHPDPTDIDLSDEPQDFRFLSHLSQSTSIPRRGEKDFEQHGTQSQTSTLDASRHAMHSALSVSRTHNPKTHNIGRYHPDDGTTIIEHFKGPLFRTLGKGLAMGRLSLLPEEALYLVERGSLDLRWGNEELLDIPMSLQAAYAYFLGHRGLTLERCIVFAGLKRCGYAVQRAREWYPEDYDKGYVALRQLEQPSKLGIFAQLYKFLFEARAPDRPTQGPLIAPGLYRSYASIYRLLTIMPAHNTTLPTDRESQRSSASMGHPTSPVHPRVRCSFHVWKPTSNFRKAAPPPPDFRIAVINAREEGFPVLEQLDDLLQSVPYTPPPPGSEGQVYKRLKHGYRNVLLAIVDQGVVSYMRVADAGFGQEKLYERSGRGGRGKRGGMRGGRGRGRGRGS